ncbi:HAD family hydrolase [Virgibacillus halotolerans]|uniref:HAD family hydrolase n=1 Tax=Virgibacillus halotolerans TaxID=1071053 RepID=UPI001961839B|nr:HAD family hydrolase [Virgibacillus halotolerans]
MISYVIWDLGETISTPPTGGMDLKPLDEYTDIKLRDGVNETIQKISYMGLGQAVLSNTANSDSEAVGRMLRRLGVIDQFDYIFATNSELDDSKPEKPDRVVYEKTLNVLNIKANEAVMVGNTWDTDVIGANRSGIHAIWLQNPLVSFRKDWDTKVIAPPWIIPVWDVKAIPEAIATLNNTLT